MNKSFGFFICCVSLSVVYIYFERVEEYYQHFEGMLAHNVKNESTGLLQSYFSVTNTSVKASKTPAPDPWHIEQEKRKTTLWESCNKVPRDSESSRRKKIHDLLQYKSTFFNHLLVDDIHKAIYCYIPKVGCSNWKRIWMILRKDSDAHNPLDILSNVSHEFTPKMVLLHNFSKTDDMMHKLETYTKFIVVRNPLERLISAYFNKIHIHGNPTFQKHVLPFVKKHRENATLTDITLTEFMDFVVSPKGRMNEHWQPYETLCHPCYIKYDIIAKLETIEEDSERFLRLIGAPEYLHYPSRDKKITPQVVEPYMKQLSPSFEKGFKKYFGYDFKRFGYDFPEENR